MGYIRLLIPELDYALPAADGERVSVSIPLDWLPILVQSLTDITQPYLHTGDWSLYLANLAKINAVLADMEIGGGGMFIGAVVTHALATVPANLLVCDGTVYNRVDYPDLYAAIHANLKIDADTFRVPDLRDKFVKGEHSGQAISTTGGEKNHTLTIAELPAHDHNVEGLAFVGSGNGYAASYVQGAFPAAGNLYMQGGGQAHNNEPQFYILRYAMVASL